ncbi:MAG: hypothetical protein KUL83_07290 [Lentimicrobium sp.]|nr:hypothetical protein [Lentimicrobium sp.]MDD2526792.1 hypothetical protein [Lentimicrobiaceae bacterium]MDD4596516.1 hypothetical protein [Lentimicrobiaceae bacterium]MDY0024758.1 hypothetical protein [Lentimicrobium sp.]HAH58793.1 hypothetical protein [Bacteroidales bacterium]
MKFCLIPCLFLVLLFQGCNKDKFPDEFTLIGQWLEKKEDPNKIELDFKRGNRLYMHLPGTEHIDTLNYKLDKVNELKLYVPEEFPNGNYSIHNISYSSRKEELVIFNLLPSTPENPSRNVFQRK